MQVLECKFKEFYNELRTIGQGRVDELFSSGEHLLENDHTMSAEIKVRILKLFSHSIT